jgi:hypothetical protein
MLEHQNLVLLDHICDYNVLLASLAQGVQETPGIPAGFLLRQGGASSYTFRHREPTTTGVKYPTLCPESDQPLHTKQKLLLGS